MGAATSTPSRPDLPLPNVPLIHRPKTAAFGPALPRTPLAEQKRLIVVDDEQPVLTLAARILAIDNYHIRTAISGPAAIRLLEDPGCPGVDLLITDLMMPGMTGRELAAAVRERYPSTRVLYVTGFADALFTGLTELGPGESFVEKPFGAEGLLEAARLLMFGHISEDKPQADGRDATEEWVDDRWRARIVRALRRLGIG
jgi:CheY-like chemotaxis protein